MNLQLLLSVPLDTGILISNYHITFILGHPICYADIYVATCGSGVLQASYSDDP
jgi:hypothetical protein